MTPARAWWILGAIVLTVEVGVLVTHPQESKAMMRTVYDYLWSVAPFVPEGYEPPPRFQ